MMGDEQTAIIYWALWALAEERGGVLRVRLPGDYQLRPPDAQLELSAGSPDSNPFNYQLQIRIKPNDEMQGFEDAFETEAAAARKRFAHLEERAAQAGIGHLERLEMRVMDSASTTAAGLCLVCRQPVRDWKPVFGSFAPEWWETQREHGVDPASGHKLNCIRHPEWGAE